MDKPHYAVDQAGTEYVAWTQLDGTPVQACVTCGALLVDDDRGPLYDSSTDDGTPHVCPAARRALYAVSPGLARALVTVATGRRRHVILSAAEAELYRAHVTPGTTGTRLWTDPQVGTYVVADD